MHLRTQSLKDKRMVLRRVKDRLQKFNVAVAEIEHQDLWQRAALGIVAISTTSEHVEQRWRRPPMKSTASSRADHADGNRVSQVMAQGHRPIASAIRFARS